jgi:hypothetical protein
VTLPCGPEGPKPTGHVVIRESALRGSASARPDGSRERTRRHRDTRAPGFRCLSPHQEGLSPELPAVAVAKRPQRMRRRGAAGRGRSGSRPSGGSRTANLLVAWRFHRTWPRDVESGHHHQLRGRLGRLAIRQPPSRSRRPPRPAREVSSTRPRIEGGKRRVRPKLVPVSQ